MRKKKKFILTTESIPPLREHVPRLREGRETWLFHSTEANHKTLVSAPNQSQSTLPNSKFKIQNLKLSASRGFALVNSAIVLMLLMAMLLYFLNYSVSSSGEGGTGYLLGEQAYLAALSGVEYLYDYMENNNLTTQTIGPIELGNSRFTIKVQQLPKNLKEVLVIGEAGSGLDRHERVIQMSANTAPRIFFPDYPMIS
ncbi:MAG TPA: hypothetical protein ENN84_05515, partial [Candidatus Marinimicrobia bacterium]|nr:hypothetical protein [Candidatus Neomarinimicrobiota bacterium]